MLKINTKKWAKHAHNVSMLQLVQVI